MHVLITADTVGGVWTYARELVCGLVRRGVRVTLVSFGEIPGPHQTEWLDALPNLDYRPTAFRLEWMQDSEDDMLASSAFLESVIHETRPDVLHFNQFYYGALEVDLPRVVVAHSDVVSWWESVHGTEPQEHSWMRWYRDAVRAGLRGATSVVAPSRWMLDATRRVYGDFQQASVIYNGRSPNLFNPHTTKEDFVLSVGRLWDGAKQVSLLIEKPLPIVAFVAGTERHPEQQFRGGSIRDGRTRVIFKGPQSEPQLRQLYGRAALYAATSRYEPFGLAPLEAAFSRCAILANDIPTFREVWGDSVLYFRANDSDALAAAVERMSSDRDLRATYANLAYTRARQRYTADRMVDEYVSLYQSLVPAGALAA